jgi:hypothetical protein
MLEDSWSLGPIAQLANSVTHSAREEINYKKVYKNWEILKFIFIKIITVNVALYCLILQFC